MESIKTIQYLRAAFNKKIVIPKRTQTEMKVELKHPEIHWKNTRFASSMHEAEKRVLGLKCSVEDLSQIKNIFFLITESTGIVWPQNYRHR